MRAEKKHSRRELEALVAQQQQTQTALKYRIEFEDLITAISTKFINMHPERIDRGIQAALEDIGRFLGADRCYVNQFSADNRFFSTTHEWCTEGVALSMHEYQNVPTDEYGWVFEDLCAGKVVHIPNVAGLPENLAAIRANLEADGSKSLVSVPIESRSRVVGELTIDTVRSVRNWSEDSIKLLRVVGEIFVNALERKWTEEKLFESQRQLATLMGNLPGMAYRCLSQPSWRLEFVSQGCQRLTGYDPADLLNGKKITYADLIHPEDREPVLARVLAAIEERRSFELIYRIITADGVEKWVWEQGAGVLSANDEIIATEGFITDFTHQKRSEMELRIENLRLRSEIKDRYRFGPLVGKSQPMQEIYQLILKAAASDENVIVQGESGSGKELVARCIHDLSDRREGKFIPVNCGAIPENLLESEFFGHRKGAFTGAHAHKRGFFDAAAGGTLFLDEIGEIDANMQVKLLRVLDGGGYTAVGGSEIKQSDCRIVAATNRDLLQNLEKGLMRQDFFYRIHIIPINVPPLRERKEDIPLLLDHFLQARGKNLASIPSNVTTALFHHDWPGNVRELENVIKRFLTLNRLEFVQSGSAASQCELQPPEDLGLGGASGLRDALAQFEKQCICQVLQHHRGHKTNTARALKIPERTLYRKIKKMNLLP